MAKQFIQSVEGELATRDQVMGSYTTTFLNTLPNPDIVLRRLGLTSAVYNEIRTDPQVASCITRYKAGVKAKDWQIDRGQARTRQVQFIEQIFAKLPIRKIIDEILDARLDGYAVLEILWKKDGASVIPAQIIGKPSDWFAFDNSNELQFLQKNGQPLPLSEEHQKNKFLLVQHGASYDNPYGDAVLSQCYWSVTFKKGGLKFWVNFTEKYGMPFAIGTYPAGSGEDAIKAVLDAVTNMLQDAAAAVPEGSVVTFPQTGSTANAEIYEKLVEYCDVQISKVILGHGGANDSTPGKLGNENNAVDAVEAQIQAGAHLVEDTFNKLIDIICQYNFGTADNAPRFVMYDEEDVDLATAQKDAALLDQMKNSGLAFTPEYFQKTYSFVPEDFKTIAPAEGGKKDKAPEFTEGQLPPEQPITNEAPALDGVNINDAIATIQDLMENSPDFAGAIHKLEPLIRLLDTTEFEKGLQDKLQAATTKPAEPEQEKILP